MNHIRISTIHALVVACMVLGGSLLPAFAVGSCSISGHFLTIVQAMPETVGDCRGPESVDPDTGDLVQPTSGGWLVFHEPDAFVTFTNGVWTWQVTKDGVTILDAEALAQASDAVPPYTAAPLESTASTELDTSQMTPTPAVPSGDSQQIDESAERLLARSELIDSFSFTGVPPGFPGAKVTIKIESRALPESQHVATFNRTTSKENSQRAISGLQSALLSASVRGFYRTALFVTLPTGLELTDRAVVAHHGELKEVRRDGSLRSPGGVFDFFMSYENGIPLGTPGYAGPDNAKLVVFYSPGPDTDPRDENMMDGTLIPYDNISYGPNFDSRRQGGLNEKLTYFFLQGAIRGPERGGIGLLMKAYESNQSYLDAIGFHAVMLHWRSDWKPGVQPTPRPPMPTATPRPPGFDPRWYIEKGKIFECSVYKNQAEAQAVLRADASDPNRLDRDRNGIACDGNSLGGDYSGFAKPPFDRTPVPRPPV